MAAQVRQVQVYSSEQLEQTVTSYITQGFSVVNRTSTGAAMFKKKEFSIPWLVIGLILCVIPLFIYLIVYASQSDQMVQIEIVSAPAGRLPPPGAQLSPDGRFWWDGRQWVPAQPPGSTPPGS